jgi:hypothetical protein
MLYRRYDPIDSIAETRPSSIHELPRRHNQYRKYMNTSKTSKYAEIEIILSLEIKCIGHIYVWNVPKKVLKTLLVAHTHN